MQSPDLAGQTFNRLTAIRRDTDRPKGKAWWHVRCECGVEKSVQGQCLVAGTIKSCGCIRGSNRLVDLTGQTFGELVVMGQAPRTCTKIGWECKCSCGSITVALGSNLTRGHTTSCGHVRRPHGLSQHELYRTWVGMNNRCSSPTNKDYPNYGGRGITVCERWQASFPDWLADVGGRPTPKHSIDRIDNSRGYEPGNVKWSTITEQNRNRRMPRPKP